MEKKIDIQDYLIAGLAQEAKPDKERFEVPQVARVIITPSEIEIYTYEDKMILAQILSRRTYIFNGTILEEDGRSI